MKDDTLPALLAGLLSGTDHLSYRNDSRRLFGEVLGLRSSLSNPSSIPPRCSRRIVPLRDGSKIPIASRSRRMVREFCLPHDGNYGFIPSRGMFVLDIDATDNRSLVRHVLLFEQLLGFSAKHTLLVRTPSGGLHVYLKYSSGFSKVQNFFNGSLRGYSSQIFDLLGDNFGLQTIDADIRNGRTENYVVGPGSYLPIPIPSSPDIFKRREYRIISQYDDFGIYGFIERDKYSVATVNKSCLMNLKGLYDRIQGTVLSPEGKPCRSSLTAGGNTGQSVNTPSLASKQPSRGLIRRRTVSTAGSIANAAEGKISDKTSIGKTLLRVSKKKKSFHAKRYEVIGFLGTCVEDGTFFKIFNVLGIDKDSHTNDVIRQHLVTKDIGAIKAKIVQENHGRDKHSAYCQHAQKYVEHTQDSSNRDAVAVRESKSRRVRPRSYKNYCAVDFDYAHTTIKKSYRGNQVLHAMRILAAFQGAIACGAYSVLANYSFLSQVTDLTRSQIRQALRILRELDIIQLYISQAEGRSSSYRLNKRFVDYRVSMEMRDIRYNSRTQYFMSHGLSQEFLTNVLPLPGNKEYIGVHTGEVVKGYVSGIRAQKIYTQKLFEISLVVARAYAVREKEHLDKIAKAGKTLSRAASTSLRVARRRSFAAHHGRPYLPSATGVSCRSVKLIDWDKHKKQALKTELDKIGVTKNWFNENKMLMEEPRPKNSIRGPSVHHIFSLYGNFRDAVLS